MSEDFLSGDAGDVTHRWRRTKRAAGELAFTAIDAAALVGRRAGEIARATPPRRVVVAGVYRPGSLLPAALGALSSSLHEVRYAFGSTGPADAGLVEETVASGLGGGKFENLNKLLAAIHEEDPDWVLVVDDDLRLPPGFLDRFVGLCERFGLDLAQPAQSQRSHSAWRVVVAGVYRPGSLLPAALGALSSSLHEVRYAFGSTGPADAGLVEQTVASGLGGGKFENLNRLLAAINEEDPDWVLVVDDDLRLPPGFLDRFVGLCERFGLDLAQPAQSQRSHSAWRVTRRRPASLVRETRFVEIGPLTAFGRRAAAELLPFPELRFGWGLDLHWAAVAAERGWRLGVVDATPVRHEAATVGSSYATADARAEAARFLADRPYLPAASAADVLATHRRVSR